MKKLILMAGLLALTACGPRSGADTGSKSMSDTAAMSNDPGMMRDSMMMHDSTMKSDSAMK